MLAQLLLLLVDQVYLHLLLLHLYIGLLLGGGRHGLGTLRAHPVVAIAASDHVVLNLLGLKTVALVLHFHCGASA